MWSWWRDVFMNFSELVAPNGLFSDGDWIEKKDQDENGTVRLIQLADIGACFFKDKSAKFVTEAKAKELNCTYLQKGDILIARLPDPLGRACIFPLDGKYITAVDVAIVRISRSDINPKYVMYMINSPGFRNDIKHYESGTTRKRISRKNLDKIQFNIPPLPEQEHIISRIEELFSQLDASVAELKTAKERLKVYRQAVLKEAFGEVTTHTPFGEIIDARLGKMLNKEKYTGDFHKYLRNINVRWFSFDLSNLLEMRIEADEIEKYSVSQNDLIICEGGEPGRCAVWDKQDSIFYQKALHRVRFLDNSNPRFYMYYLWFSAQSGQLCRYFTGTGIKHLTGQSLSRVIVPKTDRPTQDSIVAEIESRLSVCDSIENTVDTALQQAEALRQSILKKAFEGKL